MSSIKLSPNASGTGIFTIAAPNSNTDRTLTLPDQTGTVLTNAGPFTANASASAGAVTIDASNNVGIGTSSPNLSASNRALTVNAPNAGDYSAVELSSGGALRAYMNATNGAFYIASQSTNPMVFYTNGSERARIDSSGKFLVATTSSTSVGSFTGSTNVSTFNQSGITLTQYSVSAGFYYDRLNFTNSQYFVVNSGGTGVYLGNGSTAWSAYSDIRLKNVTGTYTNALADVAKLQPIKFTWKSDESAKPCVGLSAQSVQQVVPEAVDSTRLPGGDDETEYLSVRYQEVIPLLTAAIQEQQALIESLTARIAALEAQP